LSLQSAACNIDFRFVAQFHADRTANYQTFTLE